jgi:chlorobactene glucosyltransferase
LILEILLVIIGIEWVRRILWVTRYRKLNPPLSPVTSVPGPLPKISVIIPARNEERNIGNCLRHILKQNYSHYEVIVVDDRSTDETPGIIDGFKKNSSVPLRSVRVEKLPPGWTGKNYAMFAGSRIAAGEWLLFTDADTTHQPESLLTAYSTASDKKLDFLTLAPETESKSFWEKTIQPLASSSLAIWFSPEKINDPRSEVVLANGQFIFVKKEAYEKTGGSEAVKEEVVEDVALAKKMKALGFRVAFLNGTRLYSTRMYNSLKEIRVGWKRILLYLFNKNIPAMLHKIFLFFFFSLLPYAVLASEIALKFTGSAHFQPGAFYLSLFLCGLISVVRFIGNKTVRSNPWYGLLHPLGSAVLVWILLCCIGRVVFNRPSVWRGQQYR